MTLKVSPKIDTRPTTDVSKCMYSGSVCVCVKESLRGCVWILYSFLVKCFELVMFMNRVLSRL